MARAKYQVLVLPYQIREEGILYAIFRRQDMGIWQFVSGGGEDEDGSVMVSARREAFEEAGIPEEAKFTRLETQCSISADCFGKAREIWGAQCLVIPEYSFAADVTGMEMKLSHEHTEFEWVGYDEAKKMLRYDSNKVALWELDNKIRMGLI